MAAVRWVRMKMRADWGAMPAKVSVKMPPMETAGPGMIHDCVSHPT